jgi:regulator of extracellular matrix RemA (YlzA/DUF370 family)
MKGWVQIDHVGMILADRVVAVGLVESAPIKRLLAALPLEKIVVLTGGRRRRSVLVLDSGHVVVTAMSVMEVEAALWQA